MGLSWGRSPRSSLGSNLLTMGECCPLACNTLPHSSWENSVILQNLTTMQPPTPASFIHLTNIEHLLCSRHYAWSWECLG